MTIEPVPLLAVVNSWLSPLCCPFDDTTLDKVTLFLEVMVHQLHEEHKEEDLVQLTFIYANRFMHSYYKLLDSQNQVVTMLLISLHITVKFWEDKQQCLTHISTLFGMSKELINSLEKKFLATIDYSLFIPFAEQHTIAHLFSTMKQVKPKVSPPCSS